MDQQLTLIALTLTALPLIAALLAGLLGNFLGRTLVHRAAVTLVGVAFFTRLLFVLCLYH